MFNVTSRHCWLLSTATLLALLALWSWYASRPALVWYVSPRLKSGSCVHVLVPRGWRQGRYTGVFSAFDDFTPRSITFVPPEPTFRWPRWLSWLNREREQEACLKINPGFVVRESNPARVVVDIGGVHGDLDKPEVIMPFPQISTWTASRGVASADGQRYATVLYARQNQRAFDATHSAICNSLRIDWAP